MKNRIWNTVKSAGLTAILLGTVLGNCGQVVTVKADQVENTGVTLSQSAIWTNQRKGDAQVTLKVTGLQSLREQIASESTLNESEHTVNASYYAEGTEDTEDAEDTEDSSVHALDNSTGYEYEQADNPVDINYAEDTDNQAENVDNRKENTDNEYRKDVDIYEDTDIYEDIDIYEDTGIYENTDAYENADADPDTDSTADSADSMGNTEEPEEDGYSEEVENMISYSHESLEANNAVFAAAGTNTAGPPAPIPEGQTKVSVVYYLSEYFCMGLEELPDNSYREYIDITDQTGERISIPKMVFPLDLTADTSDSWQVSFQICLCNQYKNPTVDVVYPTAQDEPLQKDRTGAGALVVLETSTETEVLAEAPAVYLEQPAAISGLETALVSDKDSVKAGQRVSYQVTVKNTGTLPMTEVKITPYFYKTQVTAEWDPDQGLEIDGKNAILETLEAGADKTFTFHADIDASLSGELELTVIVSAQDPVTLMEDIVQYPSKTVTILADSEPEPSSSNASFTVEKTADRTIASPGDTITYQICIRNTGDVTLHSVISTERFLTAGISPQFTEQEGVTLNSSKTQALIPEIAVGETFTLHATVTLPSDIVSQELINQVTVVAKETGSKSVQSQAGVDIRASYITDTPTPVPTALSYYQSDNQSKSGTQSYGTSSKPQTSDPSQPGLFLGLLVASLTSLGMIFWRRKAKSRD